MPLCRRPARFGCSQARSSMCGRCWLEAGHVASLDSESAVFVGQFRREVGQSCARQVILCRHRHSRDTPQPRPSYCSASTTATTLKQRQQLPPRDRFAGAKPVKAMATMSERAWLVGDYSWDSLELLAVRKQSRDEDIVCQVRTGPPVHPFAIIDLPLYARSPVFGTRQALAKNMRSHRTRTGTRQPSAASHPPPRHAVAAASPLALCLVLTLLALPRLMAAPMTCSACAPFTSACASAVSAARAVELARTAAPAYPRLPARPPACLLALIAGPRVPCVHTQHTVSVPSLQRVMPRHIASQTPAVARCASASSAGKRQ